MLHVCGFLVGFFNCKKTISHVRLENAARDKLKVKVCVALDTEEKRLV